MPEIPYEDAEGEAFTWRLRAWMVDESADSPGVIEFSHIANETGVASKSVQVRKNKQGMRKGVPDYVCVIQRLDGSRSLVWIELKRQKDGKWKSPSVVSADQKRWVDVLNTVPNVAAHFAYGHEEACEILEKYVNSEAPNPCEHVVPTAEWILGAWGDGTGSRTAEEEPRAAEAGEEVRTDA